MTSRYSTTPIGTNSSEQYENEFKERNVKFIRQYFTPILRHLDPSQMVDISGISHTWKVGDRYYKLAHRYYGDSELWWVIAWFNKAPTESHLRLGDVILIPTPLETFLDRIGV
jgi:nucleoid-associated protein YgaU